MKIGSVADVSQSAGMYSRYRPLLFLLDCSRSIVSPGDHPRPLQAHAIEEKARWKGDNADPSATALRDSRTILRHIQHGRVTSVLYHEHYAAIAPFLQLNAAKTLLVTAQFVTDRQN